ncbi:mannose-1-phosphate guanylyltransferase [Patescibacteria group bacterium]|nr:mannose-1-phosphate guanylyltransferase [Patescibacteria group bacterium]
MKILILAGGSGTRLWPASRANSPKQIIPLINQKTLLQDTYTRFKKGFKAEDIFISLNVSQRQLVKKQLPKLKDSQLIIEPVSKNTAAAIGLACVTLAKKNPKEIVVTINSDHFIEREKEYLRIIKLAGKMVSRYPDQLVLIGLKPTYTETGYGYIKLGKQLKGWGKDNFFKVESFKEKPDLKTVRRYFKSHLYLWNPAYFTFRVDTMLSLFKKYLPDQYKILMAIKKSPGKIKEYFPKIKPISIDYGIMEKATNLHCLKANFCWADIGHWRTVYEVLGSKSKNNLIKGKYLGLDSKDNLIYSLTGKLITTVGITNSIIVDTDDALLLCSKDKAQDVKKIVENLKKKGLKQYL